MITENAAEGTDTVQSSVTYTLGANIENLTLTGTGNINGTGNTLANVITGNTGNNSLSGSDGNDTLDGGNGTDTLAGGNDADSLAGGASNDNLNGGAGNDTIDGGTGNETMIGGTGDDFYIVDSATDAITENAAEGTDSVQSSVTYTLAANVEVLTLTGAGNINGTGSAVANTITGSTGNNSLSGGDGNDTMDGGTGTDTLAGGNNDDSLVGGAGADSLDGGAGNDTMAGGDDNDIYVVDAAGDMVTEIASEGTDIILELRHSYAGGEVENLTLTGTSAPRRHGQHTGQRRSPATAATIRSAARRRQRHDRWRYRQRHHGRRRR